jgi:pSer/pThr/pTyr-binding forkhead associated (FHA) protein
MADDADVELTLTIMSGPDDGRRVRFRRSDGDGKLGANDSWVLTVGRREDCDLPLLFDSQVSREHARLVWTAGNRWVLEDSGSRNGTFVGKRRVESATLLDTGTMFRIGRTWLRIEGME